MLAALLAGCDATTPTPTSTQGGAAETAAAATTGATQTGPASPAVPATAGPPAEWQTLDIGDLVIQDLADGNGRVVLVGNTNHVLAAGTGYVESPHYWLDDKDGLIDYRPVITTSTNGVDWARVDLTPLDLPDGALLMRVVAGPAGFVASGIIAHAEIPPGKDVPEPLMLHSADGVAWERIAEPPECTWINSFVGGAFGYVALGDSCRGRLVDHHQVGASVANRDFHLPVHLLMSTDGVTWTSTTDTPWKDLDETDTWPWNVVAGGNTLVAYGADGIASWHSTDGGRSWTEGPQLFDTTGSISWIVNDNGRFVATGAREPPLGYGIRPHTCTSADGETWSCVEYGGAGVIVAMPNGYAGFLSSKPTPPNQVMNVFTSTDGTAWAVTKEPALADLDPRRAVWTSVGLVLWGLTNRDLPDGQHPFLRVLPGQLPMKLAAPGKPATPHAWPDPGTTPIPLPGVFAGSHPKPGVGAVTAQINAAMGAVDPEQFDSSLKAQDILDTWRQCQGDRAGTTCRSTIKALYYGYKWSADERYYRAAEAVYDYAANTLDDTYLRLLQIGLNDVS
jgi:hypothetical protein